MSRQLHEVLSEAMDIITAPRVIPVRPAKPRPLAQVEPVILFNGRSYPITIAVFGEPGTSELSGRPILENTRFELNGEDIEHLLPDDLLEAFCNDVLDN